MKYTLICLSIVLFGSCKNERTEIKEQTKDTVQAEVEIKSDNTIKNIDHCKLALDFLYEYEKNYDKIYEKDFLNYEGNYSVNHDNVNFFIKNAQLEKYCTQNFINQFKSLISKVDTNLKADPQLDGTIDGLEADYILHTQETEETLDQIRDRKLTCENEEENSLIINFEKVHYLKFLIKDNKIDSIDLQQVE